MISIKIGRFINMGKFMSRQHRTNKSARLNTMKLGTLFFLCMFLMGCVSDEPVEVKENVSIEFAGLDRLLEEEELLTEELSAEELEIEASEERQETALVLVQAPTIQQDSSKEDFGSIFYLNQEYQIIQVDGGDTKGEREALVAVDIGYGDRIYWGLTNEYGQLVYVLADQIIPQDEETETVNANGRYYDEEAFIPGTETEQYDQGHVIADSLGGVANAYNITPQDSVLNRSGDQAYMEKSINYAGGCTNFIAVITYPDTKTQIPSRYQITYILNGSEIKEDFPNETPEVAVQEVVQSEDGKEELAVAEVAPVDVATQVAAIDTNGNGQVTIAEARAAGFQMPIYSNHWLYPYMHDGDGDGKVGE